MRYPQRDRFAGGVPRDVARIWFAYKLAPTRVIGPFKYSTGPIVRAARGAL